MALRRSSEWSGRRAIASSKDESFVLDASAACDLLLGFEPAASWVAERVLETRILHAPHLIETEIVSTLRRLMLRRELTSYRAAQALEALADIRLVRYRTTLLLSRMLELAQTVTAYDAAYIALAEALDVPLVTTDQRLARSSGHTATIRAPA